MCSLRKTDQEKESLTASSPTTTTRDTSSITTASITRPVVNRVRYAERSHEVYQDGSTDTFKPNYELVGPLNVMKWKMNSQAPSFPTPEEAAVLCPSVKVDLSRLKNFTSSENAGGATSESKTKILATWMGHASFLIQIDGVNILTDPVFSERCSMVQFAGPKRFVPAPCKISDLPRIDIVTISHNHYDHLDSNTVEDLHKCFNPIFVVPKGMKTRYFDSLSWPASDRANRVTELGWYQTTEIVVPARDGRDDAPQASIPVVQITLVPAQHWTMRTPLDRNKQLWGGFVVEHYRATRPNPHGPDYSLVGKAPLLGRWFHAGDTGYNEQYWKEVGKEFELDEKQLAEKEGNTNSIAKVPVFDVALIPIGAYEPRFIMQNQHINPEEAVKIHKDLLEPKLSLGMHFGTFILTDEPLDEPPKKLKEACDKLSVDPSRFVAPRHGETFEVPLRNKY